MADDTLVNENFCIQNISTPKPKTHKSCKDSRCIGEWGYDDWGKVYVIVIPWAGVVCLIYTPEARGPQA